MFHDLQQASRTWSRLQSLVESQITQFSYFTSYWQFEIISCGFQSGTFVGFMFYILHRSIY